MVDCITLSNISVYGDGHKDFDQLYNTSTLTVDTDHIEIIMWWYMYGRLSYWGNIVDRGGHKVDSAYWGVMIYHASL